MKKYLSKIILCICTSVMVISAIMPLKVFAVPVDYSFYSANDILFHDPNACGGSTPNTATIGASNGNVYALGDSILAATQSKLTSELKKAGYSKADFNAVVGRAIITPGSGTTALQGATTDKAKIAAAGTILIVLGTNGGDYKSDIPKLMKIIKDANSSARIFWVNVGVGTRQGAKAEQSYIDAMNKDNPDINSLKDTYHYSVIDWHNEVVSNPSLMDANDHVHPSGSTVDKYVSNIMKSLGNYTSGGTGNSATASGAGSPGAGGTDTTTGGDPKYGTGPATAGQGHTWKTGIASLFGGTNDSQPTSFGENSVTMNDENVFYFAILPKDYPDVGANPNTPKVLKDAVKSGKFNPRDKLIFKKGNKYAIGAWLDVGPGAAGNGRWLDLSVKLAKYLGVPGQAGVGDLQWDFLSGSDAANAAGTTSTDAAGCCPSDTSSTGSGGGAPVKGSRQAQNAATVWNFLTGKGLSATGAAGVLGNLQLESGIYPNTVNGGSPSDSVTPGHAYGLAQWLGGRQDDLHTMAVKNGVKDSDLNTQIELLWKEMQPGSSQEPFVHTLVKDLNAASTAESAAVLFEAAYERSGGAGNTQRQQYAGDWYKKLKNYAGTGSTTQECSSGSTNSAGQYGWEKTGPNAMVYYAQCNPKWAGNSYGGSGSICESGCGLTSTTMILATLTGNKSIAPDKMAVKYGVYHVPGGTSHALFHKAASDYGLKDRDLGMNFDAVRDILQKGGLVIMGANAGYFTTGGHLMVIRAMTADGSKFYVADPARPNGNYTATTESREGPFTPEFLTGQGSVVTLWGIWK
ncbi:MAG: phage tail tip lysozyme [Candidatus Saccharibacteria bacterium]|nr:phage tail tip lysozyme [Candidatus Saccharibacteria bacterium]